MARSTAHDIDVLNDLIEVTLDSSDGYRRAAEETEHTSYRTLFRRRAEDRRQIVTEFQEAVRSLGGEPEDEGSMLAAAHRTFLSLRDSLSRGDEAVVAEVERGEDHIKNEYEEALGDGELSIEVKSLVRDAFESIRQGHDEAQALKVNAQADVSRPAAAYRGDRVP